MIIAVMKMILPAEDIVYNVPCTRLVFTGYMH